MDVVIYADVLFFINACVDYICFCSVYKIYKLKVDHRRTIIASLIGGIYGAGYLLFDYLIIHLLIFGLIVTIAFKIGDRMWLSKVFLFAIFSTLLGGIANALVNLFNVLNYTYIIVSVSIILTYITCKFMKCSKDKKFALVEMIIDEYKIKEYAFIDSGNLLRDIFTGKNVILIKREVFRDSFNIEKQKGFHIIPIEYKNIKIIKCFIPRSVKVILDKTYYELDAIVAIDETNGLYGDKRILLPEELIGGLL